MEPLFENTYTADKSFYQEIYRYFYLSRPAAIVIYVLSAVGFFIHLPLAIGGKNQSIGFMALAIALPLMNLILYFRHIRLSARRNNEISSVPISVSTLVHENSLELAASNGSTINIELSKIRGAVQTKNYIVLRSDARLLYSFSKDGFTKGTKDEFIAFLKSKGIKVSGK